MTNLATKLAKASLDVGGRLAADKTNQEQRYDYISADKILAAVGQALAAAGVVVIPAITNENLTETPRQGKGPRYDAQIGFEMTITDGETNLVMPWLGRGSDYTVPDKALYKAVTSGHKYFLAKLLCIGEGNEDGEHEPGDDDRPVPRQVPQPARQPVNGRKPEPPPPPEPVPSAVDLLKDDNPATVGELVSEGSPYADIRAQLEETTKPKVGDVVSATMLTGLYNAGPHALNAIKLYEGFEGKAEPTPNTTLTKAGALKLFDWLVARKQVEQVNEDLFQ